MTSKTCIVFTGNVCTVSTWELLDEDFTNTYSASQ